MRTYADACGITRALDTVGERWALPIVRELLFGPRRWSDLAAALPGVSTNMLGARLDGLAAAGVLAKRRLAAPAAVTVYELTPWGAALEPVLIALGRWAAHTPVGPEHTALSPSSFALSLRTTFRPEAAGGVAAGCRLVMGEDVFDARVRDGAFAIARATGAGNPPGPRAEAPPGVLADLAYRDLTVGRAVERRLLALDGSAAELEAFLTCFALPAPPPSPDVPA
ncbi:winged helix-turn-helix transcriptional regulator [Streptomyces marincola]|uniref:winged helix-turn-helix transcriptional regulator n=1 Tax=Streptomyces marincola TaxID=2878388 RepID=UPI001CF1B04A|nr:helix-turn-helix domain-containing protein [Streptomyces marincola]UCM90398.1 helix-turn-helix transcriptional regulator [Streptomyces marincola]